MFHSLTGWLIGSFSNCQMARLSSRIRRWPANFPLVGRRWSFHFCVVCTVIVLYKHRLFRLLDFSLSASHRFRRPVPLIWRLFCVDRSSRRHQTRPKLRFHRRDPKPRFVDPAVNSVNVKLTNVYPVLTILNSKHSGDTSNNDTDRSVGICQVPAAGQVDQDIAEVKQKKTQKINTKSLRFCPSPHNSTKADSMFSTGHAALIDFLWIFFFKYQANTQS